MRSLMPRSSRRGEKTRNVQMAPLGDFTFSLSRMRDEFDRLFERMSREFLPLRQPHDEGWHWDLEVEERDDAIAVKAEAPGFEAGDFDIRLEDGRLVLSASKIVETKDDKGKAQERQRYECYESLALPQGIDKEKVEAKYHNGVLTVTLPKMPSAKSKKVTVKSS